MGGFSSIVPMAASALQTGQQISANQARQQSAVAQTEAQRKADLEAIAATKAERDVARAEDLRVRQARARARQGASGQMAGGSGSASAVLAGYEKAALSDAALDDAAATRKRNQINQRADWRERSLLRSAQDDTVARLSAWFARRDGWGS
ncbi:hypothetical protein [Thalassospira sp. GB04J01]|uniref:hypothetical protein n=1 Tax=Thalassospira sp. GB04J01 TaxID=1485225 RepID=UPI000C9CBD01|nr:hypothetical protein [Thalassospira sp. GB04J01]|tara:strand:- start:14046 stop:14495 length:450 start_codon:yes stop_codon:yes gene_type:complete